MPALIGFKPGKGDIDILERLTEVAAAGVSTSDYLRQLIRADIRRSDSGLSEDEPIDPTPQTGTVWMDANIMRRLCKALENLEKKIAAYPETSKPSLNENKAEPEFKAKRPEKKNHHEPPPKPPDTSEEALAVAKDNFLNLFA